MALTRELLRSLLRSQVDLLDVNRLLETDYEVPTWIAVLIILSFAASLAYGLVVGNVSGPIALWAGLFRAGLTLFVVYLLYRFVVAVEAIAEKI